jgi:hypothetical protein
MNLKTYFEFLTVPTKNKTWKKCSLQRFPINNKIELTIPNEPTITPAIRGFRKEVLDNWTISKLPSCQRGYKDT